MTRKPWCTPSHRSLPRDDDAAAHLCHHGRPSCRANEVAACLSMRQGMNERGRIRLHRCKEWRGRPVVAELADRFLDDLVGPSGSRCVWPGRSAERGASLGLQPADHHRLAWRVTSHFNWTTCGAGELNNRESASCASRVPDRRLSENAQRRHTTCPRPLASHFRMRAVGNGARWRNR